MPLLRIKRLLTPQPPAPSTLQNGELVYNEALDILYYAKGTNGLEGMAGENIPIAGTGFVNEGSTNALTFNNQPPTFYLDRSNHTGLIDINDVQNLNSSLTNISSSLIAINNGIDTLSNTDNTIINRLNIIDNNLEDKASITHNHQISSILNLQSTLDSKANISSLSQVATTGNYLNLINQPTLGTAASRDVASSGNATTTEVVLGNDSRLSDSRTPLTHTHAAADVTSGTFALARIPTIPNTQTSGFGTSSTRNVPEAGNASTTEVVLGNDSRLSDARTPILHNQDASTITTGTLALDRLPTIPSNKLSGLSTVAITNNYLDLTNRPIIPTKTSDLVNDSDFILTTDSRLTDARTPTTHNQDASTITSGVLNPSRLPDATSTNKGIIRLEPTGDITKFLAGDGTWLTPASGGGGGSTGWSLTGNGGLDETINFIGTTDATPVIFRYNNNEVLRLYRTSTDSFMQTNGHLHLETTGAFDLNVSSIGSGLTNLGTSGTGNIQIGTASKITSNIGVLKSSNNQRLVATRITTDQSMSLTAGASVAVIFNNVVTTQGNSNITLNTTTGEFTLARQGTYIVNSFLTVNAASGSTIFSYLIGSAAGINLQPCSGLRYTAAQNGFITLSRVFKTNAPNQTIQIALRADTGRTATLRFDATLNPTYVEIYEVA